MPDNSPFRFDTKTGTSPVFFVLVSFLLFLMPLALFFHSLRDAQRQYRINKSYVPVEATVLSARVVEWRGSKGSVHYDAVIEYQYEVAGETFQSKGLTALLSWGDEEWAQDIVSRYKVDHSCHAWFNPDDPSQAILIKSYSFEPYLGMLMMSAGLVWITFLILKVWRGKSRDPQPVGNGWYELAPEPGDRRSLLAAKLCTAIWYGLGAVPIAHYLIAMPSPHPTRSLVKIAVYLALGLIPARMVSHYRRLCRNLSEARLFLGAPTATMGAPLSLRISQNVLRDLQVREFSATLVCTKTTGFGKRRSQMKLHEEMLHLLQNHQARAGETLELPFEFTVPAELPASDPARNLRAVRIGWAITLDCKSTHAPRYKAVFTLPVAPADEGAEILSADQPSAKAQSVKSAA